MNYAISPSNYKQDGLVRITQGWPHYHSGRKSGQRHYGVDIVCGYGDRYGARMMAIEDGIVIQAKGGSDSYSGRVRIKGSISGIIYAYKHIGRIGMSRGGIFVEEGQEVYAGEQIGTPDYSNTDQLHIHFETWLEGENINPVQVLFNVQPFLKYELSENFETPDYYKKNHPDLYTMIMENYND